MFQLLSSQHFIYIISIEDTFLVESSNRHQPTSNSHIPNIWSSRDDSLQASERFYSNTQHTNTKTSAQENMFMLMLIWNRGKERSFYCPVGSLSVLLLYIFFFLFIRVVQIQFGFLFSFNSLGFLVTRVDYITAVTDNSNFLLEQGSRVGRWLVGVTSIPSYRWLCLVWSPDFYMIC